MDKEQVIEKLEEVFEMVCSQYIAYKGKNANISLSDIRELGHLIISSKSNIHHDMEKATKHVDIKIKDAVEKLFNEKMIAERIERGRGKP
ncbi:hypothetical protein FQ087_06110 [Sporosarcina sp. ANT_H38]|uniref:hypothetical protein n=1 Tax=Sporosarcina sp. ANT_H38 TaxID=2597358 RepID=UPI0011F35A5A|nr:hypothetical protein [Sporosarcina sp. ANT_H38]KAA0965838.1 hypothetical protein FQ087_06110 [Sporosarcina sp. ANT_H38]